MSSKTKSAIVTVNQAFIIPSREAITPINEVVGDNPKATSLRDHPEWNGQKIIITAAGVKEGNFDGSNGKDYLVMTAFVYPPSREPNEEDLVIIMTGSENVFQRVAPIIRENLFPTEGTLRNAGRAWFID